MAGFAFWPKLVEQVKASDQLRFLHQDKIKSDLMIDLKKAFPNTSIEIHFFGSRIMGLGNENSDLDVFVEINSSYFRYSEMSFPDEQSRVIKAASTLSLNVGTWNIYQSLTRARFPLIMLTHIPTNIKLDINFSNGDTHAQNLLLNYMFELQPMARYMVLYLRHRSEQLKLQDSIRTHIHSLMVVYFFQLRNLLPSVAKLQENLEPDMGPYISGFRKLSLWELGFKKIELTGSEAKSFLQEYFKFYREFDYAKNAICPYLGTMVLKTKLDLFMPARYKQLRVFKRSIYEHIFVQDFIRLNLNKAYQVTPYDMSRFFKSSPDF